MNDFDLAIRRVALSAGSALAALLLALYWSTLSLAQSREDQYGSPTDPIDPVGSASGSMSGSSGGSMSDVVGVLPDTGGPFVLFIGAALILTGTGVALFRGRRADRQ